MTFDEDEYIVKSSQAYFNKPAIINISDDILDIPSHCEYCKEKFQLFNPVVNGVCQVCGHHAAAIIRNKQPDLTLSSINQKDPNELTNVLIVSSYYEYNDFLNEDDSKKGKENTRGERMKARSFMEAINMVHRADTRRNDTNNIYPKIKTKTTIDSYMKEMNPDMYIKPTNRRRGYYSDEEDEDYRTGGS